jgi:hypothetical protein
MVTSFRYDYYVEGGLVLIKFMWSPIELSFVAPTWLVFATAQVMLIILPDVDISTAGSCS